MIRLKRFQKVNNFVKSNVKKSRFKNEKEEDEKSQLLFEMVKILYFYWIETLNLSQLQLSKKFSKIFLGSTVMTKIFGTKVGKKRVYFRKDYL